MTTVVAAVMNLKGGVGKTTLCGNIARALADREAKKILIMDLDSQCNLSQLFFPPEEIDRRSKRSVYQCFDSRQFLKEPPYPADICLNVFNNDKGSRVDFICGSAETFGLAISVPGGLLPQAAQQHFNDFMRKARESYDIVMFDTNPSATFTTLCALEASNFLIAPITIYVFSLRGIHLITRTLCRKFPWLNNAKQVRILANRIPRSPSGPEAERLRRDENTIRQLYPDLSPSIMVSRIHESKMLWHKAPHGKFVIDREVHAFHRHRLLKIKEDFDQAARELLLSMKDAFGDADGNSQNSLDALRRLFAQGDQRPVV